MPKSSSAGTFNIPILTVPGHPYPSLLLSERVKGGRCQVRSPSVSQTVGIRVTAHPFRLRLDMRISPYLRIHDPDAMTRYVADLETTSPSTDAILSQTAAANCDFSGNTLMTTVQILPS
ncbi:hypothetical protein CY34DRAFT_813215 [Suillus luteus UH-Slu-Lm8-n1]|uniref:Uncharacterized protein n=1 Tax=Suillus luteus UH-Slu-Lm8-n1 TaxID=930992 RepID=A0A0D0A7C3_9AGAM|nr:hypothetical protein CY34DRAFT_813215 [Suillus luteus UH-Slu-Lm8-n1]